MPISKAAGPKAALPSPRKAGLAALPLMALVVFMALAPWPVSAQQTPSHIFSGSVSIGGQAPPNGAALTAWTGERRLGEVAVRQGRFRIAIPQHSDFPLAGREISFRIAGRKLHGTGVWRAGRTTDLRLTITRAEFLRGPVADPATSDRVSATDTFVGKEPSVCDQLHVRPTLYGKIRSDSRSISAELRATVKQSGCLLTGRLEITSPEFQGSGPFHGTIDGNFVRFTVPGKTSDTEGVLNFSGILHSDRIEGGFFSPRTQDTGRWMLLTQGDSPEIIKEWIQLIERTSPGVLAEVRSRLAQQTKAADRDQVRDAGAGAARAVRTAPAERTASSAEPKVGSNAETEAEPVKTRPAEEQKKRGFFSNSFSGSTGSLNEAIDPTTLAVIGILMTLLASAVQLFRGN